MSSEWFTCTDQERLHGGKQLTHEVLCELPPKPTQRLADAKSSKLVAVRSQPLEVHDDDVLSYPALCDGDNVASRKARFSAHAAAAAQLGSAFQTFGRDRDANDFHRLWVNCLAPHSPDSLLGLGPIPSTDCQQLRQQQQQQNLQLQPLEPHRHGAISTLLLSTNGASPADRLDLFPAFQTYLREQQDAYVALLRPEDVAAGVGACFTAALAQLSGLQDAAAEDVMGLVEWYDQETGLSAMAAPSASAAAAAGGSGSGSAMETAEGDAPGTPSRVLDDSRQQQQQQQQAAAGPTPPPAKRGGRGGGRGRGRGGGGRGRGGRGGSEATAEGKENMHQEEGEEGVVARLRARRATAGQAEQQAVAAVEAEARAARESRWLRNRRRHVVVLLEAAGRVADRGALRALLAALHAERHRLPVVLVLGLSCPAPLFASKLPADLCGLLRLATAELEPYPQQLHRLFDSVLLCPAAPCAGCPSGHPPLLLDGGAMRDLLLQSRLLEPSLAGLQAALLEAQEQHFRQQPLAPLALLPSSQAGAEQHQGEEAEEEGSDPRVKDDEGDGDGRASAPPRGPQGRGRGRGRGRQGGRVSVGAVGVGGAVRPSVSTSSEEEEEEEESDSESFLSAACGEEEGAKGAMGQGMGDGEEGDGDGELSEGWVERRRARHCAVVTAAVSGLPDGLVRMASAAVAREQQQQQQQSASPGAAAGGRRGGKQAGAANGAEAEAARGAVCEAVCEAYGVLAAWRLGLRWLAQLAERTGALKAPGGQRYSLPSLYCVAAGRGFWSAAGAASAGLGTSPGEALVAGVVGPAPGVVGGPRAPLPVKAMPEEELHALLADLEEGVEAALRRGWMPTGLLLGALRGLRELQLHTDPAHDPQGDGDGGDQDGTAAGGAAAPAVCTPQRARGKGRAGAATAEREGAGPQQVDGEGEAAAADETSPVRRRLEAQGLASPPTAQKLSRVTDRLAGLGSRPGTRAAAQPQGQQQLHGAKSGKPQLARRAGGLGAVAAPAPAAAAGRDTSIKLPSSGMTQTQRQRKQALVSAVQQSAAGGAAAGGGADGGGAGAGGGGGASRPLTWAERAAAFLDSTLRELLRTSPFLLPGSCVFTFRDAAALQRRLVGAPSLALHQALLHPERDLEGVAPGLHPGQEDAALAYQLLVGCREGTDLKDWLTEFCAASGLGHMQEEEPEEAEEAEDAAEDAEGGAQAGGDRPMGRSRRSTKRHAPRKRKAAPKQVLVLDLDGPEAEAAVDALACRFEQAARELAAVGLCRLAKRRKGTFVQRAYFPPEALA